MIIAVGPWPKPKVVITEVTDPVHVASAGPVATASSMVTGSRRTGRT